MGMSNNNSLNQRKISETVSFDINYSAAFFNGQIEQPVRGLLSFLNQKDMCILVAINERGVFVIDHINGVSLFRKFRIANHKKFIVIYVSLFFSQFLDTSIGFEI